jgi:hypothetical protein
MVHMWAVALAGAVGDLRGGREDLECPPCAAAIGGRTRHARSLRAPKTPATTTQPHRADFPTPSAFEVILRPNVLVWSALSIYTKQNACLH